MSQAPSDDHAPIGADRLAGQIITATCNRHHASTGIICNGKRFKPFLDDKSNGFQLESSLVRDAAALTRLCFALAVATLYLVAQGTQVVAQQKRRWVDPHWLRRNSYFTDWLAVGQNRARARLAVISH